MRLALALSSTDWPWKRIFVVCAVFRVITALGLVTAFNPDEYWQSLEVAHHRAFGFAAPLPSPSLLIARSHLVGVADGAT
jgi:hypothetical protein